MGIVNGRRIASGNSGAYGQNILNELAPAPGRRGVIHRGGTTFETLIPGKRYTPSELVDRKGQGVKVGDIPDRTKGGFGRYRSPASKQIVTEQVYDVADKLFTDAVNIDFDEDNADWMVVSRYRLPPNWHHIARTSPLLIAFPAEYPALPPIGFYLMADLPASPNGHLYAQAYHEAWKEPLERGWKWYCCYVAPGSWRPAPVQRAFDWRRGDSLWTYLTLINEVLGSNG